MKTRRNKLPAKQALLRGTETAALTVPISAPEGDTGEDQDVLVRTAEAAHWLNVSENTIRAYMKRGLLARVCLGTRTIRTTKSSVTKLMGQQAAE